MSAFDAYREAVATEVKATFWDLAIVRQAGKAPATVRVKYGQPSEFVLSGSGSSQEHAIKYVASDLPYLSENDTVDFLDDDAKVNRAKRFKVREAPLVSNNPGDDQSGFYKHATLTRVVT